MFFLLVDGARFDDEPADDSEDATEVRSALLGEVRGRVELQIDGSVFVPHPHGALEV
jgi:hypothetical protein